MRACSLVRACTEFNNSWIFFSSDFSSAFLKLPRSAANRFEIASRCALVKPDSSSSESDSESLPEDESEPEEPEEPEEPDEESSPSFTVVVGRAGRVVVLLSVVVMLVVVLVVLVVRVVRMVRVVPVVPVVRVVRVVRVSLLAVSSLLFVLALPGERRTYMFNTPLHTSPSLIIWTSHVFLNSRSIVHCSYFPFHGFPIRHSGGVIAIS